MAQPGRPVGPPIERLLTVVRLLAQHPAGLDTGRLTALAGYGAASPADRQREFSRDRRLLKGLGWEIRNVSRPGRPGRQRLITGDNRLRVELTSAQRAALAEAAAHSGQQSTASALEDGQPVLSDPELIQVAAVAAEHLDRLLRAVSARCRVTFRYKGVERIVHPYVVKPGPRGWYLEGREQDGDQVKNFLVARMQEPILWEPGTAEPRPSDHHAALDPLSWEIDPPEVVEIVCAAEHRPLVDQLLGGPAHESEEAGRYRLAYRVTHREAFRARLYELGTRVVIVSPEGFRREVLDELARRAA